MKEKNIQTLILCEMSRLGLTGWENPTGNGVVGSQMQRIEKAGSYRLDIGDFVVKHGRRMQYGLHKGSSDIIGITPQGRFVAIEVKTATGAIRPEQVIFIEHVRKMGGLAAVVRSADEIEGFINPLKFDNQ